MTELCYIAVKGSLHASDSSVFGLTSEEVNALSKRYPDSDKEVINGVLIKACPVKVINSLGELGYRVVCSSGETEIVWTLKREVLTEKKTLKPKHGSHYQVKPKGVQFDNSNIKNPLESREDPRNKNHTSKTSSRLSNPELARHNDIELVQPKKEFLPVFRKHTDLVAKSVGEIKPSSEEKAEILRQDNDAHEKITIILAQGKYVISNNGKLCEILQKANLLPVDVQPSSSEKTDTYVSPKKVEKIGAKPEDFAEYSTYKGPKIIIKDPDGCDNILYDDVPVILNTNRESPENPFASGSYNPTASSNKDFAMFPHRDSSPSHQDQCHGRSGNPSTHQTLDEMDFERGIWMAAMSGEVERVRQLLKKGTHPDAEDGSGYTALHYAARCGHPQVCLLLLQSGAAVDRPTRAGGATPLHRAALAGHHEICCLLLRYGANILARDIDGRTPLHRAVEGGHKDIVSEFLRICPAAAFEKDNQGKSPLTYAEERGALSSLFVEELLPRNT